MTITGTAHISRVGADTTTAVLTREPFAPSTLPYTATSATSHTTIAGFGFYTFVIQSYMAWQKGARVRAISSPTGSWMEGVVDSYVGNQIVIKPDRAYATTAGPYADWLITIAGEVILDNAIVCSGEIIDATLMETNFQGAATFSLKTLLGGLDPSPDNPIVFQSPSSAMRVIREPTSLTIPPGAALGLTVAGQPFRLWFLLIDELGYDARLAVIQTRQPSTNSIVGFQSRAFLSTQSPPGDLSGIFYSDKTMTNQPYIILGFTDYDNGLAAPGYWDVSPNRFVLFASGNPLPGDTVGVSAYQNSARTGWLDVIPLDDSIPQINEGNEVFGMDVTPLDRMSVFVVETQVHLATDDPPGNIPFTAALFRDDQSNAMVASFQSGGACAVQLQTLTFIGRTNKVHFSIRAGTATGDHMEGNGTATAFFYDGTFNSFIRITERMT